MIAIGTAGWTIPRTSAEFFAGEGTTLARYASMMRCVEINSSFYRPHAFDTYARWAASTPRGFRFAVKLPRAITHDAALQGTRRPLDEFLGQVRGLGSKLGVLLVQLPPSFAFAPRVASAFLKALRDRHDGAVVCEPRHATWFEAAADGTLSRYRVTRVAVDPAAFATAAQPGGWLGDQGGGRSATIYYRWHGSPRMYWSSYDDAWLAARADEILRRPARCKLWCVFDNTASGAAMADALRLDALVAARTRPARDRTAASA